MAMPTNEVATIKKLSGQDNFSVWKFQLMLVMQEKGFDGVVDGTEPRPTEAEILDSWIKKDKGARRLIGLTVEENIINLIMGCDSAREMWETILGLYEKKSSQRIVSLYRQLHNSRMNQDMSMTDYIGNIKKTLSALRAAGGKIEDLNVIAIILDGLPSSFVHFCTTWDNKPDADQTLDRLYSALMSADERLQKHDDNVMALAVSKSSKHKRFESKRPPPGSKNESKVSENSKVSGRFNGKCHNCKKLGHKMADCFFLKKTENDSKSKTEKTQGTTFLCNSGEANLVVSQQDWIADSGASYHMAFDREAFWSMENKDTDETISLADNRRLSVKGIGTVKVEAWVNDQWKTVTMKDVRWIPELGKNLFSFKAVTNHNYEIITSKHDVKVIKDNQIYACGYWNNNMYQMKFRPVWSSKACVAQKTSLKLLHERMGHASINTLRKMIKNNAVTGIELNDETTFLCEACQYGKQARRPFYSAIRKDVKPGEVIHTDVCGPIEEQALNGSKYFMVLKDDATEFRTVYTLRNKEEVAERLVEYCNMVKTKFGSQIKVIKSDNGREFVNGYLIGQFKRRGIIHETTAPNNPEQNGKAEREIRTLMESARSMMFARKVPKYLWHEAVLTAAQILNRVTTVKSRDKTPFELWHGKKPDISNIHVFGSICYSQVPKALRRKLDQKAVQRMFVGYQGESNNYKLFDPETRKFTHATNVKFDDEVGDFEFGTITVGENIDNSEDCYNEETDEGCKDKDDKKNEECTNKKEEDEIDKKHKMTLRPRSTLKLPDRFGHAMLAIEEPQTYAEAMISSDAEHWKKAINEEIDSHFKNSTWCEEEMPSNRKAITCRWLFKLKQTPGEEDRFKARLIARGFTQRKGIDYEEVYAPVVRAESCRVLFAKAAEENLEIMQFDVKTAFLYGELLEDVWIELPEGPWKTGHHVKLKKSLYGLKQSPNCWNRKFDEVLRSFSLKRTDADDCIYIGQRGQHSLYLALYVDDGLVMSDSKDVLAELLNNLKEAFEIKIKEPRFFVGFEIERDQERRMIKLHQHSYIKRLIERFQMKDAKTSSVPINPSVKLSKEMCPTNNEEKEEMQHKPYEEILGSLQFAANMTRPDIAFGVNLLSRFKENPGPQHWKAVKQIVRYLKETTN